MGPNSPGLGNRGKLRLPTWAERKDDVLKVGTRTLPRLNSPKVAKGEPFATGVQQIKKVGETPEEKLMALAPEEASTPEKMIFGWLTFREIPFVFQGALMGGRTPGGAVVDFMLTDREPQLVLRVMGYWHEMILQKVHDDAQLAALEYLGYDVEDIWDYEVKTWKSCNKRMLEVLYGFRKFRGGGAGAGYYFEEPRELCPYCGDPMCVQCDFGGW